MSAENLIRRLNLLPHPEGGFYKETYRATQLTTSGSGNRNISTAIYYLLQNDDKSHFHRIKSDELWFFHQGKPLEILLISNGALATTILGNDIENDEVPQLRIPANTWFAAKIKDDTGYALVSCTVSPGFDFLDFELAKKDNMLQLYPHLSDVIEVFT
jgi:predicted cupin superfamily sugar epimerase